MNPQLPYLGLQSERCLRSPKLPPLLRTIILLSGDAVKTLHHKFPASLSKKVSFQGVNGTSDPLNRDGWGQNGVATTDLYQRRTQVRASRRLLWEEWFAVANFLCPSSCPFFAASRPQPVVHTPFWQVLGVAAAAAEKYICTNGHIHKWPGRAGQASGAGRGCRQPGRCRLRRS